MLPSLRALQGQHGDMPGNVFSRCASEGMRVVHRPSWHGILAGEPIISVRRMGGVLDSTLVTMIPTESYLSWFAVALSVWVGCGAVALIAAIWCSVALWYEQVGKITANVPWFYAVIVTAVLAMAWAVYDLSTDSCNEWVQHLCQLFTHNINLPLDVLLSTAKALSLQARA